MCVCVFFLLANSLLESLQNEVHSVEIISVDLSDWKATENALKDIGNVDLLVNNAAYAVLEAISEVTEEEVDK